MRRLLAALLAPALGCARTTPPTPVVPEWTISGSPTLTIGAYDAEPGHELATVSGARMEHGVIVIANSGAHELQSFDSTGKLLGFIGRQGQGPGEFLGVLRLSPAPGDSLYVFDSDAHRWSEHDYRGNYGRNLPGGAAALASSVWPYHRILVRSSAGTPVPAWVLTLLDSLPEAKPGSAARQAVMDDLGFLWLQDSLSRSWTIHGNAAQPAGRAVLPAGFALLQLGPDFIVGIEHDSSEQELVRVYHLGRPKGQSMPPALPAGTIGYGDSAARLRMIADASGIVMAQEMFFSNHASYTGSIDSLGAKLASGAELVLTAGDKRHWAGLIYDRQTHTTCALSVGFAPDGWLDGSPFCGR